MSKFLKSLATATLLTMAIPVAAMAQDAAKGEKVFKKCKACHQVGEGAKNKVGPQLNDLFGRTAGALDGFKYSKAMIKAGEEGLVWDDATTDQFLEKPKKMIKKTKMSFSGLRKEADRANVIAYLKTFDPDAAEGGATEEAPKEETPVEESKVEDTASASVKVAAAEAPKTAMANNAKLPEHGVYHLGRKALPEEIAAWDKDIAPDGTGLPVGSGSVLNGEEVFADNCASCHGDFAEGVDNWPKLAGGMDTLADEDPLKTVGSYWPHLSTAWDYVNRSMPFGAAQTLSADEVYAIVAYILYSNDLVDEEFVLSNENFADFKLPNADGFIIDDRAKTEYPKFTAENACMSNCKEKVEITMRARVLDVTPDTEGESN